LGLGQNNDRPTTTSLHQNLEAVVGNNSCKT
jgi:hypothetical protein